MLIAISIQIHKQRLKQKGSHLILATSLAVLLVGIQATSAEELSPEASRGNCSRSQSASAPALRSLYPDSEIEKCQMSETIARNFKVTEKVTIYIYTSTDITVS